MKRIIFLLAFTLSVSMVGAQNIDFSKYQSIKFMDIEIDGHVVEFVRQLLSKGVHHIDEAYDKEGQVVFMGSFERYSAMIFVYSNPVNNEVWGTQVLIDSGDGQYLDRDYQFFKQLFERKYEALYMKTVIEDGKEKLTIADYEKKTHMLELKRDTIEGLLRILFINKFNVESMQQ